ncbi:MAG: hypothetical protein V4760_11750 [Bdellovibrionota bacterium]
MEWKAADKGASLPSVFDAVALGSSFEEVAVDVLRAEKTEFLSRWFRATRGEADLTIWIDGEKRIVKHQLSFFGQVVEWNPIHGTRTGLIVEEESASSDDQAAEIIRFDKKAQSFAVTQAIGVLSHVRQLGEEERSVLVYNLRESPKLHARARERAMQAWAPRGEEIVSDLRPGFWNRLRKWISGE